MVNIAGASQRNVIFDPKIALGWRSIGLDGLGCYLRSVEAVLISNGYDSDQVATGLVRPLDLIRRDEWHGPISDYPACRLRWYHHDSGEEAWPHIESALRRNEPVIVMYDGFHWPGDPYSNLHHYHHHMVLAHRLDGMTLHLLDIDAPAEAGYRSTVAVTDGVVAACNRYALFERVLQPQPVPPDTVRKLTAASVWPLAEDIAELEVFHHTVWTGGRLDPVLARGLHVLVLGDIQPQLFLLAHAIIGTIGAGPVPQALLAAAGRAQKLGLLLIGLHRFNAGGIYEIAHEELPALVRSLKAVLAAMCADAGVRLPAVSESDGGRFVRRLLGETQWCFGEGRPLVEPVFG